MGEPETLDSDEPLPRRIGGHDYTRLVMLSDGVFAIAMTLLVLEVKPEGGAGEGAAGLIQRLAPSLSAFSLSFAVAGVFWLTHKRLFARVRRVDGRLTAITLVLLGLIALLPAATSLIYRYGADGEARALYLALIALVGVTQGLAWAYASAAKLVDPNVSGRVRAVAVVFSTIMPVSLASLALYAAASGSLAIVGGAVVIGVGLLILRNRLAG